MRNGLSYQEASKNANAVAKQAYDKCIAAGGTHEIAQSKAHAAYEKEMKWYER